MAKQLHSIVVECGTRTVVLDQNTEPLFTTELEIAVQDHPFKPTIMFGDLDDPDFASIE